MWIGSLALAGMPFFAGYYSKDIILEAAWADHTWFGNFAFWMGIAAAFMTAFYSWRMILMTFHGKPRADDKVMAHVHESPPVMISPLIVLATGAILAGAIFYGGFVGSPHGEGHIGDVKTVTDHVNTWDKEHFWGDALFVLPENDTVEAAHHAPFWVKKLPIAVGLAGILLAFFVYMWREGLADKVVRRFRPIHTLLYNKWFFDEIYNRFFVQNAWKVGRVFSATGDRKIIDGVGPDGVALVSRRLAGGLSRFQSGYLFQYALVMMIGLIAVISWIFYQMSVRG